MITLNGVTTDLPALLANHEIVVGNASSPQQFGNMTISGLSDMPYILENGGQVNLEYHWPTAAEGATATYFGPAVVEVFYVGNATTDPDADTIDLSDFFVKSFTGTQFASSSKEWTLDTTGDISIQGQDHALPLQLSLSISLEPVVQCLSGDAQYLGYRRQTLAAFDHTHRFELELQRVTRP